MQVPARPFRRSLTYNQPMQKTLGEQIADVQRAIQAQESLRLSLGADLVKSANWRWI